MHALSHLTNKAIDSVTLKLYYEELEHIAPDKLLNVFKKFITEMKIPSIKEIQAEAKVVTNYSLDDSNIIKEDRFDWESKIIPPEKSESSTLSFRICAPLPDCSSLDECVRHWRDYLTKLQNSGWRIFSWKEYWGNGKLKTMVAGKMVIEEHKFYYAMASCCSRNNESYGKDCLVCNDFIQGGKALAEDAIWKYAGN